MTARFASHPDEPHVSKRDLAESAGFDPGEDYNVRAPMHLRAPEGVDVLAVFAVQVEAAREGHLTEEQEGWAGRVLDQIKEAERPVVHADLCDIPDCGNRRCDDCDERMTCHGPEPRACGTTCWDCSCDCTLCLRQREDMRDELLNLLERESRS